MTTEIIPIFPLQLVAFPSEQVNLHIFEERYRQLIRDCDDEGISFGMPVVLDQRIQAVGTELVLHNIHKTYDDGKMDIKTQGRRRFRILDLQARREDKLYSFAEVQWLEEDYVSDMELNEQILVHARDLYEMFRIEKTLPALAESFVVFDIAHHVGMTLEQEYQLLKMDTELLRQQFLIEHFQQLLPIAKEMENLRKKIALNGHFKNLQPPDWKF